MPTPKPAMIPDTLAALMMMQLTAYNELGADRKAAFHTLARRQMRRLARALSLTPDRYEIRSNHGGIAVSGEVTLHADCVYIQISQSAMGAGNEILFRACEGLKDYTGKQNHFAPAAALDNPEEFAEYLRTCNRFGL